MVVSAPQQPPLLLTQLVKRFVNRKAEFRSVHHQLLLPPLHRLAAPANNRIVINGLRLIRNHQILVDPHHPSVALAPRTRPQRIVEAEHMLERPLKLDPIRLKTIGVLLYLSRFIFLFFNRKRHYKTPTLAHLESGLYRVIKPTDPLPISRRPLRHRQPIDQHRQILRPIPVDLRQNVLHIFHLSTSLRPEQHQPFEPVLHQQGEFFDQPLSLGQRHRSRHHRPPPHLQPRDIVHHILYRMRPNLLSAHRRIGPSDPRKQQPQIVINFRRRPHRRPRITRIDLLFHRNGRRNPGDEIHIRLLDLPQELPRIGRQALDIPPLPLRKNSIEGQRRLPRPRQAGHHYQLVVRNFNLYILEIMNSGSLYMNILFHPTTPN